MTMLRSRIFGVGRVLIGIQVLAAIFNVAACGRAKFAGGTASNKPDAPAKARGTDNATAEETESALPGKIDPAAGENKNIDWFWQCETAPVELPDSLSNGNLLVEGTGPHKVEFDTSSTLDVHVSGFLCPPKSEKRDIVFVVDVSGSTADTDRRYSDGTGKTCERKKAVKALLDKLVKEPGVEVGLVAFDTDVSYSSSELSPISTISTDEYQTAELCAYRGGTNYGDALDRAAELLELGRENARKEVYFITDGEPNEESTSRRAAAKLREKAVIATIMFGDGDDEHLRTEVASRDKNDRPLHAMVKNVKDLATTLENLAKAIPVKGTYKYKPVTGGDWKEGDLWQFVKDGVFDIPALTIEPSAYPDGISFSFTYEDNRGQSVSQAGEITW
jgi:uncharacterized protein YegL